MWCIANCFDNSSERLQNRGTPIIGSVVRFTGPLSAHAPTLFGDDQRRLLVYLTLHFHPPQECFTIEITIYVYALYNAVDSHLSARI